MKIPKIIECKVLSGESKDVYSYISPLLMNRDVAKFFNNTAIVTSTDHKWLLLLDDKKQVCGFCCIEPSGLYKVRYIYISPDYKHDSIYKTLLTNIIANFDVSNHNVCKAVIHSDDVELWKSIGFETIGKGQKWINVKLEK